MNKEQIIKRMNPVQLAKLNGPKTEVASIPVEMSESIEAKQARGVVTIDMAEMPTDTTAEEFITQRVESAKLEFIDFHQTPPERITPTGDIVNINYTNEGVAYNGNYKGPAMDAPSTIPLKLGPGLREQLKDEAFATQFNSPLDASKLNGPAVSLPRTKKKKHRR